MKKTYIQLLITEHRFDEATQLNDSILKKTPQDPEALVLKAQIQIQQAAFDQAMLTLASSVEARSGQRDGAFPVGLGTARKR